MLGLPQLFTDIVDSTTRAAKMEDRHWRDLLPSHNKLMHTEISRFMGRVVKCPGDGFPATFDGPVRAMLRAIATIEDTRRSEIEIRTALHTDKVELIDDDVGGIAAHAAARVLAEARAREM